MDKVKYSSNNIGCINQIRRNYIKNWMEQLGVRMWFFSNIVHNVATNVWLNKKQKDKKDYTNTPLYRFFIKSKAMKKT